MTKKVNSHAEGHRLLQICIGKTTKNNRVYNASLTWDQICTRVKKPIRTSETYAEFLAMDKTEANLIKDVGHFVGGLSINGTRNAKNIQTRDVVTLDIDHAPTNYKEKFKRGLGGYEFCVYSTHKHSPEKPRFRMLLPLTRTVSETEYKAVARKLAQGTGMEYVDESSFVVCQAMYWPSCSSDAEFFFHINEGAFVDPDKILSLYNDWQDVSEWPVCPQEKDPLRLAAKKAGDPHTKPGLVGSFCRTHTISETISLFLPDVYEPTEDPNRYTYIKGTTHGGAVVYDERFLYSHHEKDPVSRRLVNAFDLVRIHKFGGLDETEE